MTESFAQLFEESLKSSAMQPGAIVNGTVIAISGDFVVVVNAAKVKLTGRKEDLKTYDTFSRFPGGLKVTPAHRIRQTKPDLIIYNAVKGMLPKNHMSRKILKRLLVYAGAEHPHQAQKPQVLDL